MLQAALLIRVTANKMRRKIRRLSRKFRQRRKISPSSSKLAGKSNSILLSRGKKRHENESFGSYRDLFMALLLRKSFNRSL